MANIYTISTKTIITQKHVKQLGASFSFVSQYTFKPLVRRDKYVAAGLVYLINKCFSNKYAIHTECHSTNILA